MNVLVWGAGGHALVVADILRLRGCTIVAFIDDVSDDNSPTFCGAPLLPGPAALQPGAPDLSGIVAIGDCGVRVRIAARLRSLGIPLAAAVHPAAIVADTAHVGAGTVIAAGAVVAPLARLDANVIINTSCSVDHECVIDEGAHVSAGARLGGGVRVGRRTLVGMGATVLPGVRVGDDVVVGAGSLVLRDVPDGATVYGVPARQQGPRAR